MRDRQPDRKIGQDGVRRPPSRKKSDQAAAKVRDTIGSSQFRPVVRLGRGGTDRGGPAGNSFSGQSV